MPRADWARSAGLKESEIKNYAIPLLKANCAEFLTFQAWRLKQDGPKMLWVSVDEVAMAERFAFLDMAAIVTGAPNYHVPVGGIGFEPELDEDGIPVTAKPGTLRATRCTPSASAPTPLVRRDGGRSRSTTTSPAPQSRVSVSLWRRVLCGTGRVIAGPDRR